MKKRILVYGFSRYLDFKRNPSGDLVRQLGRSCPAGTDLTSFVFNVSYDQIRRQIPEIFRKGPFDAVVGFGLAPGSHHIRLEEAARNKCCSPQPDTDGRVQKNKVIVRNQEKVLRSTAKILNIQKALLKKDIPAAISNDPGGYLCNFSYYLMLNQLYQNGLGIPCLFVHIPFSTQIVCRYKLDYASFPEDMLDNAGRIIIEQLLEK